MEYVCQIHLHFLNNFFQFLNGQWQLCWVFNLFVFYCVFPLKKVLPVEKHLNIGIVLPVVFQGRGYTVCNLISKNNFKKNLTKLQSPTFYSSVAKYKGCSVPQNFSGFLTEKWQGQKQVFKAVALRRGRMQMMQILCIFILFRERGARSVFFPLCFDLRFFKCYFSDTKSELVLLSMLLKETKQLTTKSCYCVTRSNKTTFLMIFYQFTLTQRNFSV